MLTFIRTHLFRPYWRETLGLVMIIYGTPIIFFFRETLKLAPGKSWFTAVCLVGSLALMIPPTLLRKMYKPNKLLIQLGFSFLAISFFYLMFYNPFEKTIGYSAFREYSNFAFIFIFLFLLINLPNKEVKEIIIPVIAFVTFAGSVGLIISLLLNKNFIIGQRAAIYFGDGEEGGNPHIFAKGGYAQLIASILYLRFKGWWVKIFSYFSIFLAIVVIIATQTRAVLLSALLALFIFLIFNLKKSQLKSFIAAATSPRNLFSLVVVLIGVYYYLDTYTPFFKILSGYADRFNTTFLNAILTATGNATGSKAFDPSSYQRVLSMSYFYNFLNGQPGMLIFGMGYRHTYFDVPVLEAFFDCGIIGFVTFMGFNVVCLYEAVRAMRRNNNQFSIFLAYYYVVMFVGIFTSGRPFDTSYWFQFTVMMRFFGLVYLNDNYVAATDTTAQPKASVA
jgi:hypothetical protein